MPDRTNPRSIATTTPAPNSIVLGIDEQFIPFCQTALTRSNRYCVPRLQCSHPTNEFMPIKLRSMLFRFLVCVCCASFTVNCPAAKLVSYGTGDVAIDACRLTLGQDRIRMFWRDSDGLVFGSFGRLNAWLATRGETLVCATNAGIFGEDLRPIGLYVEGGRILRKLNVRKQAYGNFYLQPNGVFLLSENEAAIANTDEIATGRDDRLSSAKYATQSGPVLLRDANINPLLTQGSANRVVRNAVCVVTSTEIALVRSRAPMNFYDFAQQLRDKIGCRDALYLDGSISQLYPFDNNSLGPSFAAMIGATTSSKQ